MRSTALEAAVRLLTERRAAQPNEDRGATLAALYPLAATTADKWRLLGGAAQLPHTATLALAERACADEDVRAEAAIALKAIQRALPPAPVTQ